MRKILIASLFFVCFASLTGCGRPLTSGEKGALIGGGAGAVVGGIAGGGTGALIGTAAGAIAGGVIGHSTRRKCKNNQRCRK